MARALVTYIPWFRNEAKEAVVQIRKLRSLLARHFTKKFIASLKNQGFGAKKEVQAELEEELDWICWLRKTQSQLIGIIKNGRKHKKNLS